MINYSYSDQYSEPDLDKVIIPMCMFLKPTGIYIYTSYIYVSHLRVYIYIYKLNTIYIYIVYIDDIIKYNINIV